MQMEALPEDRTAEAALKTGEAMSKTDGEKSLEEVLRTIAGGESAETVNLADSLQNSNVFGRLTATQQLDCLVRKGRNNW